MKNVVHVDAGPIHDVVAALIVMKIVIHQNVNLQHILYGISFDLQPLAL